MGFVAPPLERYPAGSKSARTQLGGGPEDDPLWQRLLVALVCTAVIALTLNTFKNLFTYMVR